MHGRCTRIANLKDAIKTGSELLLTLLKGSELRLWKIANKGGGRHFKWLAVEMVDF